MARKTTYPVSPITHTPPIGNRLYPSLEEMHPSKVQQSTTKQPDSGLRLGFVDVSASARTASPSKATIKTVNQDTPTKTKGSLPEHLSSPGFEFKWNRPDFNLSSEAQKIMDSVREEAARIKAKMQAERDTQARKDVETDNLYGVGGRKIAKPKGKVGRYSDVHMQEFKKMDSIAGHVSAWKNKIQGNTTSLKRSKSKAELDVPEQPKGILLQASKDHDSGRLENTAPAKRVKQHRQDDTSAARPVSRDNNLENETKHSVSALPRPKSSMPSAITTPTKASLARSASVKHPHTSMLPSLGRSKSTKELASPCLAKTEGNNKYLSSLAKFGSMKSILHRPEPKFSDDPTKIAAGTHLPTPKGKLILDKQLPTLPGTPLASPQRSPTVKRVEFTPSTKSRYALAAASPSPSKIPAPHFQHDDTGLSKSDGVAYPSLAARHLSSNSAQPGDFTFRSSKPINFGPSTSGLTSPTIRQVRPSGVTTPLSAFQNMPTVSHGISNKKRRRPDSDDEDVDEDLENKAPRDIEAVDEGPRMKKVKTSTHPEGKTDNSMPAKRRMTGVGGKTTKLGGAKEKPKKGMLSLSRLNMLARPKDRR